MSMHPWLLIALMPLVPQHGAAGSWDEVIAVFAAVVLTGIGVGVALWAKRLRPETEENPGRVEERSPDSAS